MVAVLIHSDMSAAAAQLPQSREQIQLSFAPVTKQTAPAVVNIYSERKVIDQRLSPMLRDPFFRQFFGDRFGPLGMPRERVERSLGSGVIISENGLVVTNHHVVKDADDIIAVLSDRSELNAKIILRDEQTDLALLQLQQVDEPLPFLQLRDSDTLEVGDLVLAIGNPFGVGQTVTSGIISATARSAQGVSDYGFFLQTDAAINPGNSGGALVDLHGRLVGVPSAIYTRSGGSNGIGFAIPANMIRALRNGEIREGRIIKPWLGAKYQNITRELADSLGLERNAGVLVNDVIEDSPANEAGLKAGDVIVAFDGKRTDDTQALRFRTAIAPLNESIAMTIIRDDQKRDLSVRLEIPPDTPARDERLLKGRHPFNGATVANLNPALAIELSLDPALRGVAVVKASGQLQRGDLILTINGTEVNSTRQLEQLLSGSHRRWLVQLARDNNVISLQVIR